MDKYFENKLNFGNWIYLGKNAIRSFITDNPEEIYKNEKIETDVMFGFNSLVSLK